jgi:hypothetical protein
MSVTSYTSEYDERKDYKEAVLDRIAELIIANLSELKSDSFSISSVQKTTKDGYISKGRNVEKNEKLLLYGRDKDANKNDNTFIQGLLNHFAVHGDTNETNYGIPVASIELIITSDGNYITAPGIPNISFSELGGIVDDNISQFIQVNSEKSTFHTKKIKEFLNARFSELVPENIILIRKIEKWFNEFDRLKNYIEPGQKPYFKTNREFIEQDTNKLTLFLRQGLDILYPQAYPVYSKTNYDTTQNELLKTDRKYRTEKQKSEDMISLIDVKDTYKDRAILYISQYVIPKLTEKYTQAIQGSDDPLNASFELVDLADIRNALVSGSLDSLSLSPPIYDIRFTLGMTNIPGHSNNYDKGFTGDEAIEAGCTSLDVIDYHGIKVACKPSIAPGLPGEWRSQSKWGFKKSYGTDSVTPRMNTQWQAYYYSHRHSWGKRHHFTYWDWGTDNGEIFFDPINFTVLSPGGQEYSVATPGGTAPFQTNFTGVSSISNNNAGVSTGNFSLPPIYNGNSSNTLTHTNGQTYKWHYAKHTKRSTALYWTPSGPQSSADNNIATFIAYVGQDTSRFSGQARSTGLAIIFWNGDHWSYEYPNGEVWSPTTRIFTPDKDDFIICAIYKWHDGSNISTYKWLGSTGYSVPGESSPDTSLDYNHSDRISNNNLHQAGRGQAGLWSGYYRRRFSLTQVDSGDENDTEGLTYFRDHGDTRGAQGFIDVSNPEQSLPGGNPGGVLRLTVNERITQSNLPEYGGTWEGASMFYHMIGHENASAISNMKDGKLYKLQFWARTSNGNIPWIVKIGDYRHGHQYPPWQRVIEMPGGTPNNSTDWNSYEISNINPVVRGGDGDNGKFANYGGVDTNIRAQICFGMQPLDKSFLSNNTGFGSGTSVQDGIQAAVGAWIEFDEVLLREMGVDA